MMEENVSKEMRGRSMNRWIAEFELEDGDTMPEHMDLEYKGARIDFHCKLLEQEPTTKKDCNTCIHNNEIDGSNCYECVKDMCNNYEPITKKDVPDINDGKIKSTIKNNLGVDCISRADAIQTMQDKAKKLTNEDTINGLCGAVAILFDLPSVTPQEPQTFKWCETCKEYDQEKHCCHRYSKVIRNTVAEMKQEPVLDKINKMKSEIADSLEFWDYSPNNNPLARDILETLTYFWGDIKAENEDKE